jgi:hypothetical protein
MDPRFLDLMKVSGQLHIPAALPPGKEPSLPIGWAEWAPEPVWTKNKLLHLVSYSYYLYQSHVYSIPSICFYVTSGSKYVL